MAEVALPKAGLSLAILALGNLLANMFPGAQVPVRWICGLLAAFFFLHIVAKFCLHPATVFKTDLTSPVIAPVSATIWMTLMQFATYVNAISGTTTGTTSVASTFESVAVAVAGNWWHLLALGIWWLAVAANVVLMGWITWRFIFRKPGFQITRVFPTWFVGYIGIVVAVATAGTMGTQAVGLPIFWFGFACYVILLPLITYRVFRHPLPDPVKPSLGIYAAPASLTLVGYVTVTSQPNRWFVLVLACLGQIFFVVVLALLPRLLRLPFFPSHSALTFPFVITATALWQVLKFFEAQGAGLPQWIYWLQLAETLLAGLMVGYVAILFVVNQAARWKRVAS